MSCDGRRKHYFQRLARLGSPIAGTLGGDDPDQAVVVLERIYRRARVLAVANPSDVADGSQETLFRDMLAKGLSRPEHRLGSMLPATERAYAEVQGTITAALIGLRLPPLAQEIVSSIRPNSWINYTAWGIDRCGECGRWTGPSRPHLCPVGLTPSSLAGAVAARLNMPVRVYGTNGIAWTTALQSNPVGSPTLRLVHATTLAKVQCPLDHVPDAVALGYVPEDWLHTRWAAGAGQSHETDQGPLWLKGRDNGVVPTPLEGTGLPEVPRGDLADILTGVQQSYGSDLPQWSVPDSAGNPPIIEESSVGSILTMIPGTPATLVEWERHEYGFRDSPPVHRFEAEADAVPQHPYAIQLGERPPVALAHTTSWRAGTAMVGMQYSSVGRRGMVTPQQHPLILGRDLPQAVEILRTASILEDEDGNVQIVQLDKYGVWRLVAAYDSRSHSAADRWGRHHYSAEQLAAVLAAAIVDPQASVNGAAAVRDDIIALRSGRCNHAAAADGAYLWLRERLQQTWQPLSTGGHIVGVRPDSVTPSKGLELTGSSAWTDHCVECTGPIVAVRGGLCVACARRAQRVSPLPSTPVTEYPPPIPPSVMNSTMHGWQVALAHVVDTLPTELQASVAHDILRQLSVDRRRDLVSFPNTLLLPLVQAAVYDQDADTVVAAVNNWLMWRTESPDHTDYMLSLAASNPPGPTITNCIECGRFMNPARGCVNCPHSLAPLSRLEFDVGVCTMKYGDADLRAQAVWRCWTGRASRDKQNLMRRFLDMAVHADIATPQHRSSALQALWNTLTYKGADSPPPPPPPVSVTVDSIDRRSYHEPAHPSDHPRPPADSLPDLPQDVVLPELNGVADYLEGLGTQESQSNLNYRNTRRDLRVASLAKDGVTAGAGLQWLHNMVVEQRSAPASGGRFGKAAAILAATEDEQLAWMLRSPNFLRTIPTYMGDYTRTRMLSGAAPPDAPVNPPTLRAELDTLLSMLQTTSLEFEARHRTLLLLRVASALGVREAQRKILLDRETPPTDSLSISTLDEINPPSYFIRHEDPTTANPSSNLSLGLAQSRRETATASHAVGSYLSSTMTEALRLRDLLPQRQRGVSFASGMNAFKLAYHKAVDRNQRALSLPYLLENATGGMGTRESGRGFGVEIEYMADDQARPEIARALEESGLITPQNRREGTWEGPQSQTWDLGSDVTVTGGELISPILYDDRASWKALQLACTIIQQHGGTVNECCGGHVHVGLAGYGDDVSAYHRLIELVRRQQDVLYRLSTRQGQAAHRGTRYCTPLESSPNQYQALSSLSTLRGGVWGAIELGAAGIGRPQDHVEFRTWDGTLNPGEIQAHIRLSLAYTVAALRLPMAEIEAFAEESKGNHQEQRRRAGTLGHRLNGEQWERDSRSFRGMMDMLFDREEDKSDLTELYARTRWPNHSEN